jgi:DNA-binding NarL/FixJ family response regulator
MTSPTIRVMIIEDHGIVREGLRLILENSPGIAVVGEAANGRDGVALFERLSSGEGIDVVVTDLGLPDIDGLEVARLVKAFHPDAHILVLSMHVDDDHVWGLLEAGVDGYLLKHVAGQELAQAIHGVARGETVLSPIVARRLMTHAKREHVRSRQAELLTQREQEVLGLLASGATSKEVAQHLGLRPKTVENHRAHILEKLGTANTAAAISFAYQEGLLDRA